MQLNTILLPAQHFGPRRSQAPEERLMIAVLVDALECIERYRFAPDAEGRRLYHEAAHWFLAGDTDWPYSFECICEILGLDANAVRQQLQVTPGQRTRPHARRSGCGQEMDLGTIEIAGPMATGAGQQPTSG